MDWSSLGFELLSQILTIVVPILASVLGVVIVKWLKDKGVKQEYIDAVEKAYTYLSDCVLYVNQTIVDYAKANGEWNEQKQLEAKCACMERFNACLTDTTELAIQTIYGSVTEWLETNIEAIVNTSKKTEN